MEQSESQENIDVATVACPAVEGCIPRPPSSDLKKSVSFSIMEHAL